MHKLSRDEEIYKSLMIPPFMYQGALRESYPFEQRRQYNGSVRPLSPLHLWNVVNA